jgi:hypothetical protein
LNEVKVLRNWEPESANSSSKTDNSTNLQLDQQTFFEAINLKIDHLELSKQQLLKDLCYKWKDVFSQGPLDLGNTDIVKHNIKLVNDQPFKEPYRRVPPALISEVREHLQEMLRMNAIRPSHSPFSSNVVIVRKKDGSIRFCIDYRKLNNRTHKDAYAIPRIDDTFHLLSGAKYFSKLDL